VRFTIHKHINSIRNKEEMPQNSNISEYKALNIFKRTQEK